MSDDAIIVVEGTKDVEALRRLGIAKNVHHLNQGESVFNFCEGLSRKNRKLVVLTDWDRKGGMLARMLKDACAANEMATDVDVRAKLAILSKKEVKDIEGLPAFIERLRVRSTMPGLPRRAKLPPG